MDLNPGNSEPRQQTEPFIYTGVERRARPRREDPETKTTAQVVGGGSLLETIGGAGAVVLAIIGLGHIMPLWMAGVGTIVVGAALIAQGAAIAARWNDLVRELGSTGETRAQLGSGMGAEVLGGAAAIALAIIALSGTYPIMLLTIAAIVLGGTLLFGSPTPVELAQLDGHGMSPRMRAATTRSAEASMGVMSLAGIAAGVLGIIGLIQSGPALTLSLVAVLVIGGAVLISGGAITARLAPRMR